MKLRLLGIPVFLACATLQVHAIGRLADITVVDRESGATLPTYVYRGEYWVAGRPGARYAISVRNRLGERVLTVTSVDGVNVLSGETASWDQTGYVFGSHSQYQITGWRKSNSEVAAFEFSAAGDSYAGRTGRPENVGVIGVALFREKLTEPVVQVPEISRRNDNRAELRKELESEPPQVRPGSAPARAAAGLADLGADSPAQPMGSRSLNETQAKTAAESMPAPKLGTAHGQRETWAVSKTDFERMQMQPSEIVRFWPAWQVCCYCSSIMERRGKRNWCMGPRCRQRRPRWRLQWRNSLCRRRLRLRLILALPQSPWWLRRGCPELRRMPRPSLPRRPQSLHLPWPLPARSHSPLRRVMFPVLMRCRSRLRMRKPWQPGAWLRRFPLRWRRPRPCDRTGRLRWARPWFRSSRKRHRHRRNRRPDQVLVGAVGRPQRWLCMMPPVEDA